MLLFSQAVRNIDLGNIDPCINRNPGKIDRGGKNRGLNQQISVGG